MDVKVASKLGHALKRSLGGLSLAEGSMLLRLRRASIAMLGLVGAVGLGLVFFISQIGWPGVLSGPLPGTPTRVGTVHDAIALTHSGPAIAAARPATVSAGQGAGRAAHRGSGPSGGDFQVGHSKQPEGGAGVRPGHGTSQPGSSQPAPAPEPVTPAPTPAATPTAVSSPPASEPVTASSNSKTNEAAVAKAIGDNSKSAAATATKSQAQKSAKDQGASPGPTKSSEASSAKAKRDESVAKTKAKAPPPAPAPEKSAPVPSPAAAKEAADAAKANQAAH